MTKKQASVYLLRVYSVLCVIILGVIMVVGVLSKPVEPVETPKSIVSP